MKRSTDRILVTHQGTLPRPDDLRDMLSSRGSGQPYDREALAERIQRAMRDAVRQQVECGIDVVNDCEMSKTSFSDYVSGRLGGLAPTAEPYVSPINSRDLPEFPEYFASRRGFGNRQAIGYRRVVFRCVAPLTYIGQQAVQMDIANLKAALASVNVEEAYLPAVAPGSVAHWLQNAYYEDEEAFLYAIADAMREEYKAIVDSGFLLQIDDPDLADGWQVHPHLTLDEYRQVAELRTAVLNHALRGIPASRVRMHMCWGSYHGPHKYDLPLRDFVDIVLQVQADSYSIEASNPRHAHEWRVWEEVKLPPGKQLVPGVVGHCSDFIEHPELIAERLVTYGRLVGRENIMGGTDCGLGTRVGHGAIAWAKFQALAEGARLASQRLWS
jgi:5-methyltetrahydropteroyltriglutamate--homocysteine methyltransferase